MNTVSLAIDAAAESGRRKLTTGTVALLIIASASPLGAIMGMAPVGFIKGNGPGLPIAYLLAGVILVCFAAGFSRLTAVIPGGGAFYLYIRSVFGPRAGMASAFVALLSYLAMTAALGCGIGYFTDLTMSAYGIKFGWGIWACVGYVAVGVLGMLSADIGARVLTLIVLAEFAVLLVLNTNIGIVEGAKALPVEILDPSHLVEAGFGISLMIGFASFVGFEAAALYAPETVNPEKSIPAAMLIAVFSIGIFYFATTWFIVGGVGYDNISKLATDLGGGLVPELFRRFTSPQFSQFVDFMFCGSLFAGFLSLHNAATRYVHTIAREGALPHLLGTLATRQQTPAWASLFVSFVTALFVLVPALLGADPYLTVSALAAAFSTLGIVFLQAIVAVATVVYFRRHPDRSAFRTIVLPSISLIGLTVAVALIVLHFDLMTGSQNWLVNSSPAIFLVALLVGWTRRVQGEQIRV